MTLLSKVSGLPGTSARRPLFCFLTCSERSVSASSDAGGTLTFTEGYFIATETTLYFDSLARNQDERRLHVQRQARRFLLSPKQIRARVGGAARAPPDVRHC